MLLHTKPEHHFSVSKKVTVERRGGSRAGKPVLDAVAPGPANLCWCIQKATLREGQQTCVGTGEGGWGCGWGVGVVRGARERGREVG